MTLLLQLVWPLEALGWIINLGQRATAAASRSFAWLDGIAPLHEPDRPVPLPSGPLTVRFEDVCFSYETGAEVLSGVDLEVAPGEIVAVCGTTGAGQDVACSTSCPGSTTRPPVGCWSAKSTRARSLSPTSAARSPSSRRSRCSSPCRSARTCSRRAPTRTGPTCCAACDAAGVSAFVDELPDGYDTLIGERGVNLSGGQRQRVALARALVSGARVLVLDDPMSAVDTETERHLVENLRPAVAGKTVLISGQRLSTVLVADRAVVLQDGRVIESGHAGRAHAQRQGLHRALRGRGACRLGLPAPASRASGATRRDAVGASAS